MSLIIKDYLLFLVEDIDIDNDIGLRNIKDRERKDRESRNEEEEDWDIGDISWRYKK